MTPLLSALQATTVEPLPEDATAAVGNAAAVLPTEAITGDNSLNLLQLILHASLPVQLVMILLLFA